MADSEKITEEVVKAKRSSLDQDSTGAPESKIVMREIFAFYYAMSMQELRIMNQGDYYGGLSYNSVLYLSVIDFMPQCTISSLAETLRVTKSAATLKVNELVRQKAVVKTQSVKDKRVFYLELSAEMKQNVAVYDAVYLKIDEVLKQRFSLGELEIFCKVLRSISGHDWTEAAIGVAQGESPRGKLQTK